ncbi:MAG: septum site-determining protein MinC [Gammaproteobacteria bacterium]|nr:septum site-determining protein MinC [Gammaproteobacteria bacterium]MBU2057377.1 septum site-determining protein MinC [Gammaproteobacteria bacterium]MBU2176055.1 septum site-determining protein MinC [Gammaproteobacteria bacterium]MBU2245249.1 septum site-determining protein MinC [Gammaproteobacteria bacterium]MBU2344345.1 septum site-determining protein MinC [Gammaproteobacteria bacterium]
MSDHSFELKGSLFPLSVLYCQDLSAAAVKTQLQQKLAQAPAFFYRAPVVINVESATQAPDFEAIAEVFKELELVLVGVCGASSELKKAAQAAGLAALQLSKSKTPAKEVKEPETKAEAVVAAVMETKVVEQNIRSGQQIYAKGADLVIRGTVGAGAEVIADGNIHIYGTLRGKAIAGAAGDNQKRVFCHKLEAELISIAGSYWLSDSLQGEYWGKSACIGLQDDKLVLADLL